MSAPVHPETLPPALRVSIERNAQALARALSAVLPAAVEALSPATRHAEPQEES